MKITLEIHQDEAFNFFAEYDKLGDFQKEIWKYITWMTRRYPLAFPCQTRIAEHVGCSRKHVNASLAKFQTLGWLALISRGRKRSKALSIPSYLLQLDLVKREYFKRVEVTSKVTHSLSRRQSNTGRRTGDSFHEISIPSYLEKTKFTHEQRLKLALVAENFYRNALESINYQLKRGIKIDDPCSYVVGAALRMAEKAGVFLDWKKYYGTLKNKAA